MPSTFALSRFQRADLFMLLILLLAALKHTWGIKQAVDIYFYDESNYLSDGVNLLRNGLPPAPSAPLYAVWYYGLSLLQPDRVDLYYLNYVLTTVLPPLLLYVLLRVNRVPLITSAVTSTYLLIASVNFLTWPRVSHVALIVLLVAGIIANCIRRASNAYAALTCGVLLAAFVRPEYFVAFLLSLGFSTVGVYRSWRRDRLSATWLPLGATILAGVLFVSVLGLPVFSRGGGARNFMAFGQHFAAHWVGWSHIDPQVYNPWTNWQEIVAKNFGNATTVLDAARHNPHMFAKHVFSNLIHGCYHLVGIFVHHDPVLLPPGSLTGKIEDYALIPFLLGLLYFYREAWIPRLRSNFQQYYKSVLGVLLLCTPGAMSVLEIAPRDHYLLLPMVAGLFLAVMLLRRRDNVALDSQPTSRLALFGLVTLMVVPAIPRAPTDTPNTRTIRYIQSLPFKAQITELDAEGGYSVYLPVGSTHVAEYENQGHFDQLLLTQNINLIVGTERLRNDSHMSADARWIDFLEHYGDSGFEALKIPGMETTLFVKKGLLVPLNKP